MDRPSAHRDHRRVRLFSLDGCGDMKSISQPHQKIPEVCQSVIAEYDHPPVGISFAYAHALSSSRFPGTICAVR